MELATERSPMDGGDVGARGFPLSADDCNPLQHPLVQFNRPKALAASESHHMVIASNMCEQNAYVTGWQYREIRWREKRNNSMEMWIGSNHGTSLRGLGVVGSTSLTANFAIGHISEAVLFPTIRVCIYSENVWEKNYKQNIRTSDEK
jgi:hypothetical protein